MFLRRTRRQTHGTVLPDGQCVSVIHWRLWKTPHLFHPCPQESFGFRELIPLMSWPSDPSQAKWKCLPGLESSRLLSFSDQVKVLFFFLEMFMLQGKQRKSFSSLMPFLCLKAQREFELHALSVELGNPASFLRYIAVHPCSGAVNLGHRLPHHC